MNTITQRMNETARLEKNMALYYFVWGLPS